MWIGLEPEFEDPEIVIPYTLYAAVAGKPVRGSVRIPIAWRNEVWQPPDLPTYDEPELPPITRTDQTYREKEAEGLAAT
jgi:hypothetical protein